MAILFNAVTLVGCGLGVVGILNGKRDLPGVLLNVFDGILICLTSREAYSSGIQVIIIHESNDFLDWTNLRACCIFMRTKTFAIYRVFKMIFPITNTELIYSSLQHMMDR